jgi:hypothetical protein
VALARGANLVWAAPGVPTPLTSPVGPAFQPLAASSNIIIL